MLSVYVYNTANGQVLGRGSYQEAGDGASARAVAFGNINPTTQYAPGGVITARPTFNLATLVINKLAILADSTDSATISGVPNNTLVRVFKDQDASPRAAGVVTDGTAVLRVDTPGTYQVVLSNFPTQEYTFTVVAT
jgi:hypothetical protein